MIQNMDILDPNKNPQTNSVEEENNSGDDCFLDSCQVKITLHVLQDNTSWKGKCVS